MIKIFIPGYILSKAVGSDRAKCPGAFSLVRCFFSLLSRAKCSQKGNTEMWQGLKKKKVKAVLFGLLVVKTVPRNTSQETRNGASERARFLLCQGSENDKH